MSIKAIVTPRVRESVTASVESSKAAFRGLKVRQVMEGAAVASGSMLVRGDRRKLEALERQGFRVKLLPDGDVIQVGAYRINTMSRKVPAMPAALRVPTVRLKQWRHHLVQLAAPPTTESTHALEALGAEVVEKISTCGVFVVADADAMKRIAGQSFVDWTGPFQPAYRLSPNLKGLTGRIKYVNVGVYPPEDADAVVAAIRKARGKVVNDWNEHASFRDKFRVLIAELDATALPTIASHPSVRWVEHQPPTLTADEERSAQIVAENLDGAAPPNTAPVTGYQASLAGLGISGAGVIVGICDSGVDTNNNAGMHADLAGRMLFFVDQTGGLTPTDTSGHGTHVAGIAVGNAASGDTDPQGFLLGQGVAPGALFGVLNPVDTFGSPGTGPVSNFCQLMVQNGADVMNNSWKQTGAAGSGYTAGARTVDQLVRDPDVGAAELEHLVIVFSAGNAGPGPSTITPPKEAKNPIVVGNSRNFRPGEGSAVDDIRGINNSSSRGPALDGRILPTIVAPGSDIVSARSSADANLLTPGIQLGIDAVGGTPYVDTGGTTHANHASISGTSMAAPHVAGLCALLVEWWRSRTGGRDPSPALLKAMLVNGAEDLAGGPNGGFGGALAAIPNNHQGWGRVSLENILLQAPNSDRGPKIFSDQRHAFTAAGQEHMIRVASADITRPLRITLTWTDAAGAVNATPALVNDLDLEVTEVATGNVFRGNVFAGGFSTTGGAFDNLNNIECVYVQNPAGAYEVRVIAGTIAASASPDIATPWQDFALVIDNAEVPAAAPVNVVPVIDRSGSMITLGYVNVTRSSSKQFVDLLSVDDGVAVTSFSFNGAVEFPTGASPAMQAITGQPVRDVAKAEIDGIVFGGSTFMGDGIAKARDLLAATTGTKAIVLLSDGFDNKGFNSTNPSALDVVATLPADVSVYTCAMGPASDQALLDQIATATDARYYFMPTIDDLFEIYNYIRGQVTGDAIVANESASASSSRVAVFVDALASEATISVAWANPNLHYAPATARKSNEVCVRLRDPKGRLLHPHTTAMRRTVGAGYVVFELQSPMPGRWYAEVSTAEDTHVRYTVGGFVRSPIQLHLDGPGRGIVAGAPIAVRAQVFHNRDAIDGVRATATVTGPLAGLATLADKHRKALLKTAPIRVSKGDAVDPAVGKLLALRQKLLKDRKPDLFARIAARMTLRAPDVMAPKGPVGPTPLAPGSAAHALLGKFTATQQDGSYNVVVTASGVSPATNARFVRKDMLSVVVR